MGRHNKVRLRELSPWHLAYLAAIIEGADFRWPIGGPVRIRFRHRDPRLPAEMAWMIAGDTSLVKVENLVKAESPATPEDPGPPGIWGFGLSGWPAWALLRDTAPFMRGDRRVEALGIVLDGYRQCFGDSPIVPSERMIVASAREHLEKARRAEPGTCPWPLFANSQLEHPHRPPPLVVTDGPPLLEPPSHWMQWLTMLRDWNLAGIYRVANVNITAVPDSPFKMVTTVSGHREPDVQDLAAIIGAGRTYQRAGVITWSLDLWEEVTIWLVRRVGGLVPTLADQTRVILEYGELFGARGAGAQRFALGEQFTTLKAAAHDVRVPQGIEALPPSVEAPGTLRTIRPGSALGE